MKRHRGSSRPLGSVEEMDEQAEKSAHQRDCGAVTHSVSTSQASCQGRRQGA